MPSSLIGGLTVFLFSSVAVAGIRILAMIPWTRRDRFIATASLSMGFAAVTSPDWFSYVLLFSLFPPVPIVAHACVTAQELWKDDGNREADFDLPRPCSNFFTYSGNNTALQGFLDALVLIVEEGYLITMLIGTSMLVYARFPYTSSPSPFSLFLPFPDLPS